MTTNCQEKAVPIWWLGATERAWLTFKSSADFSIDLQNLCALWGVHDDYSLPCTVYYTYTRNEDNTCITPLSATLHLYEPDKAAKWSRWRIHPIDFSTPDGNNPSRSLEKGLLDHAPTPKSSGVQCIQYVNMSLIWFQSPTYQHLSSHSYSLQVSSTDTNTHILYSLMDCAHARPFVVSGRGPQSSASQKDGGLPRCGMQKNMPINGVDGHWIAWTFRWKGLYIMVINALNLVNKAITNWWFNALT